MFKKISIMLQNDSDVSFDMQNEYCLGVAEMISQKMNFR